MATIDLPAVDSDVNVFVTVMNVFGTGGNSKILIDEISELSHTYICMYMQVHNYVANLSTYILFITGIYVTGQG